jgi:glycerate dehydrogenase
MEHIVFLERDSLDAQVRRPAFAHSWEEHGKVAAAEIVPRLKSATIAIVNKTALRAEAIGRLPALKLVAVAATGTDNIDVAACGKRGIVVSNIRNYAVHTVPEHTFALILALRRNLIAYREDVARGLWQKSERFCLSGHPIRDLHGSTLGIFGEGSLGQGVATLARAFGMRVLFADHAPPKAAGIEFTPADRVLQEADIVSLHLPATPQTRNMIGARELAKMKPEALLINTARGGLVDEDALANALRQGTIAGAGFDVLSAEPPVTGNPLLAADIPNFILTPHVAWASREAMQSLADQLMDNVESFARGAPRNVVG